MVGVDVWTEGVPLNDEEIALCAAEAAGRSPQFATVEPLTGKQGLIVCRVRFADGSACIFKAIREARKHEIAVSQLLCKIVPDIVPRILGSDEDQSRGLYWLVTEDLGRLRLADCPSACAYSRAGHELARMQLAAMEHSDCFVKAGAPTVDVDRWEEIALRLLETAQSAGNGYAMVDLSALEEVVWSASRLAQDAAILPVTLIHGDLHAANVAVMGDSVKLMDWGSAYLGAAFLGLEELLWPAARHLRSSADIDQVRTAYLRTWAPILGKPGHLQAPLLACRTLVRMELLLEALRPASESDPYAFAATYSKTMAAYQDWKRA